MTHMTETTECDESCGDPCDECWEQARHEASYAQGFAAGQLVSAVEKTLGEKRYHIVNTDNFGGDYPNESFVAQNIPSREIAEKMADSLNTHADAPRWYLVVEDGYVLVPGFEP